MNSSILLTLELHVGIRDPLMNKKSSEMHKNPNYD